MQKVKGTKDIFNKNIILKNYILDLMSGISESYNFKRIETPIIEFQNLFKRSVGETSDIVAKEMYTFKDKKDRDIVLRPEGTAPVARAVIENKLYANKNPLKLFSYGPMFRYENPQKGRQRQFEQFSAELFGDESPYLDTEIILLAHTILKSLNINFVLKLNSLGDKKTRESYFGALKKYFTKFNDQLEPISIARLDKNPLRILDDKIESKKEFVINCPKIKEFYSDEANKYFETIKTFLNDLEISYEVDDSLVRGIDYYTNTIFEFVSNSGKSGSQSTIIGGGRYQNLISDLGGPNLSGVGFGLGVERLINELDEKVITEITTDNHLDIFVMNLDESSTNIALGIVYSLRKLGLNTEWNSKPKNIKKAFEMADKNNPKLKIIIGKNEALNGKVVIKKDDKQETIDISKIIDYVKEKLGDENEEN